MVFGLFGRNKAPQEVGPNAADADAPQVQLRTPSPSASISAGTVPPQSPDDGPGDVPRGVKRSRSMSPNPTIMATSTLTTEEIIPPANPTELLARIKKVPPKILHEYVASQLPLATPEVGDILTAFFATLAPPPKLHCVRCHKDFVEVENTDRSCLVPHDDESAEVEYVGNSKSKVAGVVGTTYETLWGCCNRVVEGDGDQGPPDGWCYEGFHTTDIKRARFRADSTVHDDKLVSCRRKRCFNPHAGSADVGRGRSQRAAARKSLREASDVEEDYDARELEREALALAEGSDAGEIESVESKKKKTSKNRKRKSEMMDIGTEGIAEKPVENILATPIAASVTKPKGKGKTENMKPRSATKPKQASGASVAASPTQPSPSPIPAAEGDVDMAAPDLELNPKTKPKKPRKPRKSTGTDGGKYKPSKDNEESSDFNEEDEKPKRKKARRKSTVSAVAPSA